MRVERTWIPMPDGVRLAVTLYRPTSARPGSRFPALLEYLPYRKDDQMAGRDYDLYSYPVPRGYVGARVDVRGTGASEGVVPPSEYSEQEQADGVAVIEWLASQPWSSGTVGVWGISWGGFNAIHLAMRRPPALKAIVALMATDDLFQDDIHYIDGMTHVDEWEPMMDLLNAMTAPPDYPLDEESLAARFDTEPWKLPVLQHQRDGTFWRAGSLNTDYGAIDIPVMAIGGAFDGYRDSVPRMVQHLAGPVKGLVGPWAHDFPHSAVPGPAIEWREVAVRWWDRWLKDEPNGIEDEPALAVYVRRWHAPDPSIEVIPGAWRWVEGWPPPDASGIELFPHENGSLRSVPGTGEHRLAYVADAGVEAGHWWGEVPVDQAPLDAACLSYDAPPLDEDLVVVGMPVARLRVSADAPLAHWFARLCDVAPDGTSVLVAGAGVNGAHRKSSFDPVPMEPGEPFEVEIEMHFTAWTFEAGHRIRLAVSNSMWPMIWPTPHPMTTTLSLEESRLLLPLVAADSDGPAFADPEPKQQAPGVRFSGDSFPTPHTVVRSDGETTLQWAGTCRYVLPFATQEVEERMAYRVRTEDPADASVTAVNVTTVEQPGRRIVWRGALEITSDATHFDYRYRRELEENDRPIREREWKRRIPRDHQ
jgi:predicted acyl esterase